MVAARATTKRYDSGVNRRHFLIGAAAVAMADEPTFRLGYNTYCLRAWRWNDAQLLNFAGAQKLDAIFLQDSLDPNAQDPKHWLWVKERAAELNLHLETGGGGILPKTKEAFPAAVDNLKRQIERAHAMGSKLARCVIASERASLPPGPAMQHLETVAKLFAEVRTLALDRQVKLAVEVHKDFQAWEFEQLIQAVGTDLMGIYLDTGNPVFVAEHPLTTIETLGRYALTVHLRDSIVYRTRRGVAVQWVPLGEGTYDWNELMRAIRKECSADVAIFAKPITGRPPQTLPVFDAAFWKPMPMARSADFARFLQLTDQGQPYESHVVIEDLQNRPIPPQFLSAVQAQQQEHVERSLDFSKKRLNLGRRWRDA
jgi:3-oxoisoapionate decarboxylase